MRTRRLPVLVFGAVFCASGLSGCQGRADRESGAAEPSAHVASSDTSSPTDPGAGAPSAAEGGPNAFADAPSADAVIHVTPPADWVSSPTRLPRSIHLTWEHAPDTTQVIQWTTTDVETSTYTPRVWAVKKADLDGEAMPMSPGAVTEGQGVNYQLTLAGTVLLPDLFVSWSVELTGLQPDTEYVYRVGTWEGFDGSTGAFINPDLSPPATFRTGLSKGSTQPFALVMAGDSRGGTAQITANMPRLQALDVRMWFFNGDMTNGGTQLEWDKWLGAMQPVLRRQTLMPVQGNHELFADLFYNQFRLPQAGDELPPELMEHAWSLNFGNAHFVGLDTNTTAAVEGQLAWLEADLKAARADPDINWIVCMSHHPAYSASTVHGSTKRVQDFFVPLFDTYHVDLVFAGHDHAYERTKSIRNGEVVPQGQGVVYVVAGAFYSPAYANGHEWWTEVSHHGDVGNLVRIEIDGKTLRLVAWPGDQGPDTPGGEPLDTLTLTKP